MTNCTKLPDFIITMILLIFVTIFLYFIKGIYQCLCVFSTEIQTPGKIIMKFGTEVELKGWKVIGWVLATYTQPLDYGAPKGGSMVPLEPKPFFLEKTL